MKNNPHIQAFHKWENGLADNLEEIRITGEPTMHKMDYLIG